MVESGYSPEEILGNPGLLKLELMRQGIKVRGELRHKQSVKPAFGVDNGLDLILPESTWVTAPFAATIGQESPFTLSTEGKKGLLSWDGSSLPPVKVECVPPSPFIGVQTSSGIPLLSFGACHGNFLALSPIGECKLLGAKDQCLFCSLPTQALPGRVPPEDVVEAVRIARAHRKVEMVFLNVGILGDDDRGIRALEPYIRAIKKAFDILVAVDALPPSSNSWIDRTYAMGVDSISYNMEVYDPAAFARLCPGLDRTIGRNRFLDALHYATTVFPPGAVISHLIVGSEPIESTVAGVEELVRSRVVPVLPVFRPFKGVDLRVDASQLTVPGTRELSALYGHLYQLLKKERLPMDWVQQISAVTTPAEGRFFVEMGGLGGLFQRLAPPGKRSPSATLSDWRRALRVKEVDDSLKSSGL